MFPYLGQGLGFRLHYSEEILRTLPTAIDWFEIISDDYFIANSQAYQILMTLRQHYPIVMHGVSLSIGSTDPLDFVHLGQLKQLADNVAPAWISEHLCWSGVQGKRLYDLLPLPYTEEAIKHVVARIRTVQNFLQRPLLLENVSSYVEFNGTQLKEWEFLSAIAEEADCFILLDINNIYVSAYNHNFDPLEYLNFVPQQRVKQFHLAGHHHRGDCIVDTHDAPVIAEVWSLYARALQRFGPTSTLIERDDNFPPLQDLLQEIAQARAIARVAELQAQGA